MLLKLLGRDFGEHAPFPRDWWLQVPVALTFMMAAVTSMATARGAGAAVQLQAGTVAVCIVQDKSESTGGTGVPQLEATALAPLVDLVKERGGEIALTIVREASNVPLTRLYVPTPPASPADGNRTNVIARAREGKQAQHDYEVRYRTWNEQLEADVRSFFDRATTMLAEAANAPATDLWAAVRRCDAYLDEPGRAGAKRFLVAITDGIDTVSRNPRELQSDASVLLVPGTTIGGMAMLKPETFESAVAAFRAIGARIRRVP